MSQRAMIECWEWGDCDATSSETALSQSILKSRLSIDWSGLSSVRRFLPSLSRMKKDQMFLMSQRAMIECWEKRDCQADAHESVSTENVLKSWLLIDWSGLSEQEGHIKNI